LLAARLSLRRVTNSLLDLLEDVAEDRLQEGTGAGSLPGGAVNNIQQILFDARLALLIGLLHSISAGSRRLKLRDTSAVRDVLELRC